MPKEVDNIQSQPLLDENVFDDTDEMMDASDAAPPAVQPKRKLRPWLITTSIVLIVVLLGGGALYWQLGRKTAVQFTEATVTTGNLSTKISSTGPVNATVYNLNFAITGTVRDISVKIGQQVKAGQIIANITIDTSALHAALDQAKLDVASAQSSVDSSDNASTQNALAKAKSQLKSAQAALDTAWNNSKLVAPADGTIAAINGAVGQGVSGGNTGVSTNSSSSSSNSGFIVLVNSSKLSVTALVNEADIAKVKAGQPVQFTVSAYSNATFKGTVAAVQTVGQTSSNVVGYPVIINVDTSALNGNQLYQGMTATVNITTAQSNNALLIPASALTFPTTALQNGEIDRSALTSIRNGSQGGQGQLPGGQGNNQNNTQNANQNKSRVVLVLSDGKLTPKVITTGLSSSQFVEVLSGLKAGDKVVIGQTGGASSTSNSSSSGNNSIRNGNQSGGNFIQSGGGAPGGAPPAGGPSGN